MCGIAGYSGRFEHALLGAMAARIAHRGPDDEGLWSDPSNGVGLAHRRLSIIDLSPRGHNPLWDVKRRAAIVYNGELYNYRELRRELIGQGFVFASDTDTEVLLNLYLRDGPEMLAKLNGMFAFAIWDVERRRLFVARDGIGVKPLYWSKTPRGVVFASELKALLCEPSVPREIEPAAVASHVVYLWAPSPLTMLRGVHKLPPGHAFLARDGAIEKLWRWYDLPYAQPVEHVRDDEATEAVREQLYASVKKQLVADVPVGAFLSGGLDSSSVVAMARRAAPDTPLRCFTIGFDEAEPQPEGMNEDLRYARLVAEKLGVDLEVITVQSSMIDQLETMLYHLDEPQADPAPINTLFIARLARERGIKVLLSGSGGDDIFSGYRRHFAIQQEPYWSWLPQTARAGLRGVSQHVRPRTELRRRLAKAFRYADRSGDERIASYFYWLDPANAEALYTSRLKWQLFADDFREPLADALRDLPPETPPLNRMLYLDGRFFLADHNLNYADKIPMAAGVEVRVPFLDPDLVALAARLPLDQKQRGSVGKWVLRKAMEPYLPPEVMTRSKAGFGAPLRQWMRNDLRPLVDDVLAESALARRGLFDPHEVRALIAADREGRKDGAYALFAVMCIELWLRIFLDRGGEPPGGPWGQTPRAPLAVPA
jgi:asparagine synthase (glutamine-hydrolysing)